MGRQFIAICWLFSILSAVRRSPEDVENEEEQTEEALGGDSLDIFTEEQLTSMKNGATEKKFEAEVSRLMEIIIHSLYTDRDIFMRELISNAGDACDKIRYKSLTDKTILGNVPQLEIRIQVDKNNSIFSITDTGIGMTRAELEENLGTVARSGTARFLESFKATEGDKALSLIGQFGVGFYSAFLVADQVTVISKNNDDPMQHVWTSTADGQFTVSPDPRGVTLGRGTQVILHLKDDAQEYLDNEQVEEIISRYSMFQSFPIKLFSKKTEKRPVEYDELTDEEKSALEEDDDDLSVEDDEEEEEKDEFEDVEVNYWKTINEQRPLWLRTPADISEDEYQEFYKSFTKNSDNYLTKVHFKAEGQIEFSSMLFIPTVAPHDLYNNYYTTNAKISLYVRRVLVSQEFEDFLPRYLSFVKGMVDSNDLPLNVNREQLQKNKIMKVISKKLTRKALDMMLEMSEAEEDDDDPDDDEDGEEDAEDGEEDAEDNDKASEKKDENAISKYSEFWREFADSVKLGILEDTKNQKKLIQLLRFKSTRSPEKPISLKSYVDNMPENQQNIYYMSAGSLKEAQESPFLERVRERGFEVLYFIDNLDEYMKIADYEDYPLQSVAQEGLDLSEGKAAAEWLEEKEEEFKALTDWMKNLYGDKVQKISLSNRLENTPMIIPTSKNGQSARMERILKGQAFGSKGVKATKVLELNFRHPIIKSMKQRVDGLEENEEDKEFEDYANILYDVALLNSGFEMEPEDTEAMTERLEKVVRIGMNVASDAEIEPMPEFAEDDYEEEEDDEDDEDDEEEEFEDDEEEDLEESDEKSHDEL